MFWAITHENISNIIPELKNIWRWIIFVFLTLLLAFIYLQGFSISIFLVSNVVSSHLKDHKGKF